MNTLPPNPSNHPDAKVGSTQHTVPRLLLRPFEVDTKRGRRVWVHDKDTGRISDWPTKRVAAYTGYYDAPDGQSLDGCMTWLEDKAGAVLARLRAHGEMYLMSAAGERLLAWFVATQFYRTRMIRDSLESLGRGDLRAPDGTLLEEGPEWIAQDYAGETPKGIQLKWLVKDAFALAHFLFTKRWMLVHPDGGRRFVTSDHPVLLSYQEADPNDAAYLPLAPRLCLAMVGSWLDSCGTLPRHWGGQYRQIFYGHVAFGADDINRLNANQYKGSKLTIADDPSLLRALL